MAFSMGSGALASNMDNSGNLHSLSKCNCWPLKPLTPPAPSLLTTHFDDM